MLDLKLAALSPALLRVSGVPGPPTPPPPPPPPPRWTVAPSIAGTPDVGATLTVANGTLEGGTVTGRAWRRDGTAIPGATGPNYTLAEEDAGTSMDVVLTAGGPGGVTQATTPAVGPVAPVAPTAPAAITRIVIEGDSITSTSPNQPGNHGDFYSYVWKAARPGLTVSVAAQAGRTVGGPGDTGSPAGNTLLEARAADIATGPQLLTVMIGANDMASFTAEEVIARLEGWAAPIRQAGIRIAFSPPTPYRDAAPRHPSFDAYSARRAALIAAVRAPAGWSRFADAYIPMGEHPDFAEPALIPALYGDGVHPSGPVSAGATGQARLYAVYDAAMTSLLDGSRSAATTPYASVWPADETNLAADSMIVRRTILSGLSPAGVSAGAAIVSGGAQLRLNGAPWGATVGRVYNGDVIDVRATTAAEASGSVAYDLRIGTETRTITLRTVAAVTPAAYRHGGIRNVQPEAAEHLYAGLDFAAAGTAVLAVKGAGPPPTSVTIGGAAATRAISPAGEGYLDVWTAPVAAAGARDVVVRHAGFLGQSTLSWGVVENAEPVPVQVDGSWPLHQSAPHETGPLSIPARGIAIAIFGEYGGATVAPATTRADTTFVDEGRGTFQGEIQGLCIGTRTASGTAAFDFVFGSHPRAGLVFKAAGS